MLGRAMKQLFGDSEKTITDAKAKYELTDGEFKQAMFAGAMSAYIHYSAGPEKILQKLVRGEAIILETEDGTLIPLRLEAWNGCFS